MKTVVMTGATSFLGQYVLKALLGGDYFIHILVRKDSKNISVLPAAPNLNIIYGSLDNLAPICKFVDSADYFIHFAWGGSGNKGRADKEEQQRNIEYSMEALEIAQKLQCGAFFFSGSQAEYGILHREIFEDTMCCPISEYGKAKLQFSLKASRYCNSRGMRFIHLRIFSVYGIGDRKGTLVDSCVKKFNTGQYIVLGPCTQKWNYLYVEDFAQIFLRLLEKSEVNGIYNIASKDTRVLKEFVKEIYQISNQSGGFTLGGTAENPEGSPDLEPNIDKMINLIGGYNMKSFKEGIEEMMKKESIKEKKK